MPLLFALALAAQSASTIADPYHAQGTDPDWSLIIADGRMTFEMPGRPAVSVTTPPQRDDEGILRFDTPTLGVSIMPMACTDRLSGRRYPHAVDVTIGHIEQSGCGGTELASDSLDGTSWHFAEIGGEAVPLTGDLLRDDAYAIDFSADGFVGYDGCNRFSAAYSRNADNLTAHAPWGSTMGRCADSAMARAARLRQILAEPVRISFPDSTSMVLTGGHGTVRLVRTPDHRP
jgi:heat shock protein HslJ